VTPLAIRIPDGQRWLRVAARGWGDPLDTVFSEPRGGRWNPPGSFPVLYLNADLYTARAQILALLEGQPVRPEELEDDAYVLVAATLPGRQSVADAISARGLAALGLPKSYPRDEHGRRIARTACQPVGAAVHASGLRGVSCRSAATSDGTGRELAWFPARRSSRAKQVGRPVAFGVWWYAPDADQIFEES